HRGQLAPDGAQASERLTEARPTGKRWTGFFEARLEGEAGDDRGQLGRLEAFEDALRQRLGGEEVDLRVQRGQGLAPGGQLPAVHVTEGLEDGEHAVESAGQRVGPAPERGVGALDVAALSLRLAKVAQVLVAVGTGVDRVLLVVQQGGLSPVSPAGARPIRPRV